MTSRTPATLACLLRRILDTLRGGDGRSLVAMSHRRHPVAATAPPAPRLFRRGPHAFRSPAVTLTLVRKDDAGTREAQEQALRRGVARPDRTVVDARHRFAAAAGRARRRMAPMSGAAER